MKKVFSNSEFNYWEGTSVEGKKIFQITRHDEPKPVSGVNQTQKLLDRFQAPTPPTWDPAQEMYQSLEKLADPGDDVMSGAVMVVDMLDKHADRYKS